MSSLRRMPGIFRFILEPFQRSIRNKLIVTMIGLSCVPLIFISLFAAENTRRSVEAEVIESNSSKIKWTAGYLGERFEQMNNIIYTLLINESYIENHYLLIYEDINPLPLIGKTLKRAFCTPLRIVGCDASIANIFVEVEA